MPVWEMNDYLTPSVGRARPRIVLLEDDKFVSVLVECLLRSWFAEIEFTQFSDGDDAWQHISERELDLIITDNLHPGLVGLEILRRLAATKSKIPIIWSCGGPEEVDQEAVRMGLNLQVLPKPYQFEQFWEKLDALFGPCTFDNLPERFGHWLPVLFEEDEARSQA
jgi:DNA-binding response OmpR family regulator